LVEIESELLLKLLGSEMKSSEQKKSKSEEDLEEVGNVMDFGGEL